MKSLKYFLAMAVLLAFTSTDWAIEWTNGGGDQLWSNGANWQGGAVPGTWAQIAQIDAGLPGPIVDGTVNMTYPALLGLNIGDSGNGVGTLTVTGGVLKAGTYGTAMYGGTGWIVLGFGDATNPNSDGVLNMQGGTIDAMWDLMVAAHGGGDGTINMTGGTIWAHRLWVGWGGGHGQINLDGGVIAMPYAPDAYGNGNLINMYGNSNIDITGGRLDILGDFTTQIGSLIGSGNITAFDGTGTVLVNYDQANNITSVYAPEPMTMVLLGLGSMIVFRRKSR
jgi:hypothetical protein